MAQTIGVVVAITDDGRATVVAEKGQGCGSCSSISQCHGGRAANTQKTPALNRIGAVVGDRVTLTVESVAILSRMAVLYLLPVFGILVGAFTGAFMYAGVDGTEEGHSVVFGLAGFAIGFLVSIVISRIWSAVWPITPVITRVVNTRLGPTTFRPTGGCGGAKQ